MLLVSYSSPFAFGVFETQGVTRQQHSLPADTKDSGKSDSTVFRIHTIYNLHTKFTGPRCFKGARGFLNSWVDYRP